jgi:nucleotidyltransferase/DNA polymerase involved in DNA repair
MQVHRSTGILPSIGIASNKLVAQLASLYPEEDGVALVEEGKERVFLADIPLAQLPGVDSQLALTCTLLGLTTISHFAALPLSAVKQRFGAGGEHLHRMARGVDPRPVVPPAMKDEIVARYDCEDGSIEEALEGIRRLVDICVHELQERRVAGMLVGLRSIWPARDASQGEVPSEEPVQQVALPAPQTPHLPMEERQEAFPIPYRIHSMLPQPIQPSHPQRATSVRSGRAPLQASSAMPVASSEPLRSAERVQEIVAMVRTPIDTVPPLLARAEQLLIRSWPRAHAEVGGEVHHLLAIELKVGEFATPSQLSFSDFDRLDEMGTLQGLSRERRQVLTRQDDAFRARYGRTAFSHVAGIDGMNVLTERRFRWEDGLPWPGSERARS